MAKEQLIEGKRRQLRIVLEVQIKVVPVKAATKLFGWIEDLSLDGLKFKAEIPASLKDILHTGDEVSFETDEEFYSLRGRGQIIWVSVEENIAGVKFSSMDAKSRKAIEEFLRMCF